MTTLQQVDRCLSGPYPNDLWSDYMFEEVTALMQKLTPAEFAELRSTWPYKSTGWQTRCADILPWASAPRQEIASILLEMILIGEDELVITAADTLREFDPATVAARMTPELDGGCGKSRTATSASRRGRSTAC